MTDTLKEITERLVGCFAADPAKPYTLTELIEMAEGQGAPLSALVVAQAMAQEKMGYEELLADVTEAFSHNLGACELGLTEGRSFLLGSVASDLNRENKNGPAQIEDDSHQPGPYLYPGHRGGKPRNRTAALRRHGRFVSLYGPLEGTRGKTVHRPDRSPTRPPSC